MENQHDAYKISLPSISLTNADERAKLLLEAAKKQTGMVPNMYENMANFPALLETYGTGYNLFRKEGGFTPAEQEVIFLTISKENGCDYCMAAHSVVADMMSKVPVAVTDAIRNDEEIPDAKLRVLSKFTSVMLNKRGRPSEEDVQEFLMAEYTEKHILAIILAISVKTISNYSNHIFQTEVDTMFKAREWSAYKLGRKLVNFFR
ncbi:carboxymuconolactone decarboxylase family protein [Sediminibacterium sp.]|uniref:carboxymuconolactone decarboxylase family protein n=1 Tax=Sediminibacterium sp. TaxID=1917865 RepID=UPI0025E4BF8D|nr:carboxymuconolactone decarboxylase family protein [Sediminibacterium sp.]MBT9484489.1 carboxymuconolactone decarboxylase family protein [Sediminibacterium sp.]